MKIYQVKFLSTTEDGQEAAGSISFANGKFATRGLQKHFVDYMMEGIIGKNGKEFKPEDGLEFLKNLKYEYSGSYFRATEVTERNSEETMNFPQCIVCTHLIDSDEKTCEAYPEKIPDELFFGSVSHEKSFKDDNGILFEMMPEVEEL